MYAANIVEGVPTDAFLTRVNTPWATGGTHPPLLLARNLSPKVIAESESTR